MVDEIKKYARIMYEKNFLYGLKGSISARFEDDYFIINKNIIYDESDRYFTKLALNENYKYKDASNESNMHSLIYNNFSQAKVMAVVVSDSILKINQKGYLLAKNNNIYSQNFNILDDSKKIINHIKLTNYILLKDYGLVIFSRDFNELFSNIFSIDLAAKISL